MLSSTTNREPQCCQTQQLMSEAECGMKVKDQRNKKGLFLQRCSSSLQWLPIVLWDSLSSKCT